MPSLNDSRKTVKTKIPSIEGSEVVLWDELTAGDAERISNEATDTAKGLMTLFCLIESWNLDEPLTMDNLKKLKLEDFTGLMNSTSYAKQISEDEAHDKKKA